MRFLIDAQLPQGLTKFLSAAGHDAEHVAEIGLLAASDQVIWHHAKTTGAAVITKDADFAALTILDHGACVVWIRFGNTRKVELERRLASALPLIVTALRAGDRLVEVT